MEKTVCVAILTLYGVVMLMMCYIIIFSKDKKPRNKVRFYVTKNYYDRDCCTLWLGRPVWKEDILSWDAPSRRVHRMCNWLYFHDYNLNPDDFSDMKYGEIREVFINLED